MGSFCFGYWTKYKERRNNVNTVVPRIKCDKPFGYLFRCPVVYHTVIYHIECDMSWDLWYTTTRWRPKTYHSPPWYITLPSIISRCDMSPGTCPVGYHTLLHVPWSLPDIARFQPWRAKVQKGGGGHRRLGKKPKFVTFFWSLSFKVCHLS